MHVSLSHSLFFRRFAQFSVVIMAVWVTQSATVCATRAEDTCSFDETVASESIESEYVEELCGWGTHDSGPIRSRTSASFESSLASVAATACASAGISFEQIVEPFAMVGPHVSDSMERVKEFQ